MKQIYLLLSYVNKVNSLKFTVLTVLILISKNPLLAQAPITKEWDKTFGGGEWDHFTTLALATDGGYLVGGFTDANAGGDKSQNSKGSWDYWVVKLNADGTKAWDKTFGGDSSDLLYSAVSTSDGGFLLTGYSNSTKKPNSDKTENPKGSDYYNDYWVIKLNADGTKAWDRTYGGDKDDHLSSVISTPDGGFLLGGSSYSGSSGEKSEEARGLRDYWIVKLYADGTKAWDKTYGGSGDDFSPVLTVSQDGNYLIAGNSNSSSDGDKTETNKGSYDYWIIKVDTNGNKIWDKTYGGNGYDYYPTLAISPDGAILLGGFTDSGIGGDKTDALKGGEDYWVLKLSPDGTKMWDKSYGGPNQDWLKSIVVTADGGYLLGGWSSSASMGDNSGSGYGYSDYWIVKITADGTKVWDKTYGGTGSDMLKSMIATAEGGYLLGGESDSEASGNKVDGVKSGWDYWVVKINDNGTKIWDKSLGGSAYDSFRTLTLAIDNGYLLAGSSSAGSGSGAGSNKSEVSKGATDYWVVKLDVDGKKEWDRTFGGRDGEDLQAVIKTKDGGYLLGGSSGSYASHDVTENSRGITDYWVVKLDSNGNKIWDKRFGGDGYDDLYSLAETPDGGYLLAGNSNSSVSGDKTENNRSSYDYWIVKIDANGNKMWDRTYGGSGYERLFSILTTHDDKIILGGESNSEADGDKTENSKGTFDYWVVKLNDDGSKIWDKTIGGSKIDVLYSISSTLDNKYLLGGWSDSGADGDKTESSVGGDDFWVVKIDSDGNIVWDKTIGSSGYDYLYSISKTADGGFLLGGTSSSEVSGDKSEPSKGGIDYWVVKIDSDGNIVWDKTIGGKGNDDLPSIATTADGGFLLGGTSSSEVSGDKSEPSKGGTDYWVLKYVSAMAPTVTLSGTINSPRGTPINNSRVKLKGSNDKQTLTTSSIGSFSFTPTETGAYSLAPASRGEIDATNGITTLDIVQIQRHILGVKPLATPYKIIAADVNNSGSVTTLDIALIRSLILHNSTSFPGNRNWAFVKSDFLFTDPTNPFPFDSTRTYSKVSELSDQDFIGIKLGDVNDSWDASVARIASAGNLYFNLQDQQVKPGTEVVVPVTVSDFKNVSGYQFTLSWDPEVLEFSRVEHSELEANYGMQSIKQGKLTTVWAEPNGGSLSLPNGAEAFKVRFRIVGGSKAESKVEIGSALTRSVAYTDELEQLNVRSEHAVVKVKAPAYSLFQNYPNPFSQNGTSIRFSIPEQDEVSISIYNSLGQVVKTFKCTYEAGEHELLWDGKNQQGQRLNRGAYFYRMEAGRFTEAKQAIIQ
ncbi:hypothetical protein ABID22_002661 [Pontibacter aydingkolensis]|uniref:T9SS type A sorting domain-containing protein n=1 Tax=Pontibacter aydingkolensis TaxID=1911536 RepID=A0ABS7CWR9_9BACT|nr:FlgD immunoglobulin-like domain containing protein [Pontibacter aydingkolensis]MBW7468257.1 T9SS type A sorting domain-containing protein [Pontibacter aydingkolensis]